MGCSASASGNGGSGQKYDRRPKISVRVQPEAKKLDQTPLIIFIFGGPGSHKGRILEDLMTCYGFKFLSGEDVIFEDFPKSVGVQDEVETAKDMKNIVNDNDKDLDLKWVLGAIAARIEASGSDAKYVVDIMPSLRYFYKIPGLVRDCSVPLHNFEQRFPVCFALNLSIPADRVVKARPVKKEPGKSDKLVKDGQNDEADAGRTEKRAVLWAKTAKTYLDYFSKSQRVVTVDVSSGVSDNIWYCVHEFLCDMHFTPQRTVNTVILFTFDEDQAHSVDTAKYIMEPVDLKVIASNPNGSMEAILKDLSVHIDTYSKDFDSFLVHCAGTALCSTNSSKNGRTKLILIDIGEGYIEDYLQGSPKNYTPPADSHRYHAISSIENEVCLFPVGTDDHLCSQIAELMLRKRSV